MFDVKPYLPAEVGKGLTADQLLADWTEYGGAGGADYPTGPFPYSVCYLLRWRLDGGSDEDTILVVQGYLDSLFTADATGYQVVDSVSPNLTEPCSVIGPISGGRLRPSF